MNVIQPQIDGPLKVRGDIEIVAADGTVLKRMAEAWLCRCGQSAHKPFCDGNHKKVGFRDPVQVGAYQPKTPDPAAPGATLRITPKANGPLRCLGEMQIRDARDQGAWIGE